MGLVKRSCELSAFWRLELSPPGQFENEPTSELGGRAWPKTKSHFAKKLRVRFCFDRTFPRFRIRGK